MMIVSSLSYLLLGSTSLYEKQVPTRLDSPVHVGDFAVDLMGHLRVRDAVVKNRPFATIPQHMRFEEMLALMVASNQQDFPVVDRVGHLSGIISMTDLRRAMADTELHRLLIAKDVAIERVETVTMDDSLNTALQLMSNLDVRELPVVSGDSPHVTVSLISRKEIVAAYHREMERMKKA
jgi:chloride channel protein, CIC family